MSRKQIISTLESLTGDDGETLRLLIMPLLDACPYVSDKLALTVSTNIVGVHAELAGLMSTVLELRESCGKHEASIAEYASHSTMQRDREIANLESSLRDANRTVGEAYEAWKDAGYPKEGDVYAAFVAGNHAAREIEVKIAGMKQ